MKLVAHYWVDLPVFCKVYWHDDDDLSFNFVIDEFDILINLTKDVNLEANRANEERFVLLLRKFEVQVSKEEQEGPPSSNGPAGIQQVFQQRRDYYANRSEKYEDIARQASNRFIRFLKYRLRTPFLRELPEGHKTFQHARWTDESGNNLGILGITSEAYIVPGEQGQTGVQAIDATEKDTLLDSLQNPVIPSLYEEILSDAQTAYFEENLRRAVLELAIACEIHVKQKFYSTESTSRDLLKAIDKGKVQVIRLIDENARDLFGRSFKSDYDVQYKNIDHLFRCRNKLVHKGQLKFQDDGANWIEVDSKLVTRWWNSALALIDWIDDL